VRIGEASSIGGETKSEMKTGSATQKTKANTCWPSTSSLLAAVCLA
jgi:hypothetical protein